MLWALGIMIIITKNYYHSPTTSKPFEFWCSMGKGPFLFASFLKSSTIRGVEEKWTWMDWHGVKTVGDIHFRHPIESLKLECNSTYLPTFLPSFNGKLFMMTKRWDEFIYYRKRNSYKLRISTEYLVTVAQHCLPPIMVNFWVSIMNMYVCPPCTL